MENNMEVTRQPISLTDSQIDYNRQSGIITQAQMTDPVILIGAGGIGSPAAVVMCKMGIPKLTVYDDDKVEPHNLPNQMYRKSDLNRLKVEALKEICEEYSDVQFTAKATRFNEAIRSRSVVVSGVDSMESRKQIWEKVRLNPAVPLYIDARMAKEMMKIYRVNPTDMKSVKLYEESLHSDEEALPIPCTEKAIIYNTEWIASHICHLLRCHYTGAPFNYNQIFHDFTSSAHLLDANI